MISNIFLVVISLLLFVLLYFVFASWNKIKALGLDSDIIRKDIRENNDVNKDIISRNQIALIKELSDNYEKLTKSINERADAFKEKFESKNSFLIDKMREGFDALRRLFDDKIKCINDGSKEGIKMMDSKLDEIRKETKESIQDNFRKATETFNTVLQRLSKMDEVQKDMQNLSQNVLSLDQIFNNDRSIGVIGESALSQILQNFFGENKKFYDLQHTLKNTETRIRPDAVIFFPDSARKICIDSKFPVSVYQETVGSISKKDKEEHKKALKDFRSCIKKHIQDVSKYVVKGETAEFAIMFIPAESIFSQIQCYCEPEIEFARQNKVLIASPNTLMAICYAAHAAFINVRLADNAKSIKGHLDALSKEFVRYYDRWESFRKKVQAMSTSAEEIHTTSTKIKKRFEEIKNSDLKDGEGDVIDSKVDLQKSLILPLDTAQEQENED